VPSVVPALVIFEARKRFLTLSCMAASESYPATRQSFKKSVVICESGIRFSSMDIQHHLVRSFQQVSDSQVMDLREQAGDADEGQIRTMLQENSIRCQHWESAILQAFQREDVTEARNLVHQLTYWRRLEQALKDRL
jgi:hypothetical protein